MRLRLIYPTLAATLIAGCVAGCADILGFPDYRAAGGAGGATTTSVTTTSSDVGGGGATTSSSTSSMTSSTSSSSTTSSATGGAGGSSPMVCVPGDVVSCYTGPPETLDIGACKAGTKTCGLTGAGYGPCTDKPPKVEDCATTTVDESCDGLATCTGQLRFARSRGDSANQRGNAIAASADGRVIVVGAGQGTIDLGGGATTGVTSTNDDLLIAAYGPLGQHLWSRRLGDASAQAATSVAVAPSGDVVVVGVTAGVIDFGGGVSISGGAADSFVARFDREGVIRWAKVLHAATAMTANAVAAGADGATYIAGQYEGAFAMDACSAPANGKSAFVARLGVDGACVWVDAFGNTKGASATTMSLDASGAVLVAGTYDELTLDVGGTMLTNGGVTDTFVAKLAPITGAVTWAKSFTGAGEQSPWGIGAPVTTSNVFVTGRFTGASTFGGATTLTPQTVDAFLVALGGADGATLSATAYGAAGGDYGQALAVDGAGNVIVGINSSGTLTLGSTYTTQGGFDGYVVKLDATTLAVRWVKQIGGAANGSLFGLATDGVGRVYVTGTGDGALSIDGVSVPAGGGQDLFVIGLAP